MKNLVIGYGEIGQAVGAVIGEHAVINEGDRLSTRRVDVMHICFPPSDDFLPAVFAYIKRYSPKHIVIWSTVPIGTTKVIPNAVHSPVEGRHPKLEESIRLMPRWFGYNTAADGDYFAEYFDMLGLEVKGVENSDCTEALKLLSTTEYGINLAFADYKARVAEAIGMDYQRTKEWNADYNELYENLGMEDRFQKFVLDPPGGIIGGHCVTPNAKLLYQQFPDMLVKLVEDMA